ncbi:hypothetical protein ACF090_13225 [Streptomyces sp. NPDC014892]|uniref:hypothetical protein n=1 Tax=Streptomyces sp. NPDC014892 TaxID=3364930 RepID=UPI0037027344
MTTTEQPALPGTPEPTTANIPPRHRPWRYILVTKLVDYDDDGDETEAEYVPEGYDDLEAAQASATGGFEEGGVWDNWAGVWVVEPDWSDEVEMTAEGSAPYSARPEAA